ncbi:MAG: thioredoxin reductase, partial [Parcubacteria group bacterium CG11_big_fil_rev_8_21_14_0_20_41_14]
MQVYDLIIIGSGAAGLSAAIYAARYRLNTLVIGEQFGGETALAGKIENYPGFKAVDGFELMNVIKEQASALQVQIVESKVIALTRSEHCFELTTDKNEVYQAHEIILAQGAERRRLGLPNEKELTGHGISYCVTCDGPLYRNKTIALVGSGDAAVKGLNLAAEYVEKIYLIVRGKEIKADPINYE